MSHESLVHTAYAAFASFGKPDHYIALDIYPPERADYEEMLRNKTKENLLAPDVGRVSWNPLAYLTPEAMAYFLPRFIELAVTKAMDIDDEPFMMRFINFTSSGPSNNQYALLGAEHVRAVHAALEFILQTYRDLVEQECWLEELENAIAKWRVT